VLFLRRATTICGLHRSLYSFKFIVGLIFDIVSRVVCLHDYTCCLLLRDVVLYQIQVKPVQLHLTRTVIALLIIGYGIYLLTLTPMNVC